MPVAFVHIEHLTKAILRRIIGLTLDVFLMLLDSYLMVDLVFEFRVIKLRKYNKGFLKGLENINTLLN